MFAGLAAFNSCGHALIFYVRSFPTRAGTHTLELFLLFGPQRSLCECDSLIFSGLCCLFLGNDMSMHAASSMHARSGVVMSTVYIRIIVSVFFWVRVQVNACFVTSMHASASLLIHGFSVGNCSLVIHIAGVILPLATLRVLCSRTAGKNFLG